MDRRPDDQEQSRSKRQKTNNMESSLNDRGGVPLWAKSEPPTTVKVKKEEPSPKASLPTKYTDQDVTRIKRPKKEQEDDHLPIKLEEPSKKTDLDPSSNPYLAHMYEEEPAEDVDYNGYSNGYSKSINKLNGVPNSFTQSRLPRHASTAAMAKRAEDGPNNHFSGQPLSSQYFSILKTRRNLPVHAQR